MRRATLPKLLIAAAIPLTTIGAVVALAPAASAATCSDLEVVFARGSGEMQGLGIVGTPLVSAVKAAVPKLSVTSYAVEYAAAVDQSSAGPGATVLSNHVKSQAAACPNQRFVLGGYSQGGSVVDIAIGSGSYLGQGGTIPTSLAPRIVTVTAFGNPLGMLGQTIKTASSLYGPKSIEFCSKGDPICGGTGTGPGDSHLSYAYDGSTTQAAKFVAAHVGTAPSAPANPVPVTPPVVPSPVPTPVPPVDPAPVTPPVVPSPVDPAPVPTPVPSPVDPAPVTPTPTAPTPGTPSTPSTGWMSGIANWWSGISTWFGGFVPWGNIGK